MLDFCIDPHGVTALVSYGHSNIQMPVTYEIYGGMIFKKVPPIAGVVGLIINVPVYGFLHWQFGEIAFLNRMAITFVIVILTMLVITLINPATPKEMPVRKEFDMKPSPAVKWLGIAVLVCTLILYMIFW